MTLRFNCAPFKKKKPPGGGLSSSDCADDQVMFASMRRSSMLLPAFNFSLIQRGVLPRPAHVFEGAWGFWYFGWT